MEKASFLGVEFFIQKEPPRYGPVYLPVECRDCANNGSERVKWCSGPCYEYAQLVESINGQYECQWKEPFLTDCKTEMSFTI